EIPMFDELDAGAADRLSHRARQKVSPDRNGETASRTLPVDLIDCPARQDECRSGDGFEPFRPASRADLVPDTAGQNEVQKDLRVLVALDETGRNRILLDGDLPPLRGATGQPGADIQEPGPPSLSEDLNRGRRKRTLAGSGSLGREASGRGARNRGRNRQNC